MMKIKRTTLALLCGLLAMAGFPARAQAAEPIDYHDTPPSPQEQPFVVPPDREPQLDARQMWLLLRQHVKYVFVIYQENRSFDSYFGTFPGADGLFSQPASRTPGFYQELLNCDGSVGLIHPFRIGLRRFAADTDDVDHSHDYIMAKMDVLSGHPNMDHFALAEERKYSPTGDPTLEAKQFGELTMAYEDGDTIPLLWRYADRFVLFDHIFQLMTSASTPGNLSIIAAQSGQTQWVLHPNEAYQGGKSMGVPVMSDGDPFWGSPLDRSLNPMPTNLRRSKKRPKYEPNLTFASLPLTLRGDTLKTTVTADTDADDDLADVQQDIGAITGAGQAPIAFGWFQEGYDKEPAAGKPAGGQLAGADPVDDEGLHASYITHHNGPQYFGYIANNPRMRRNLHGLGDFFTAVRDGTLPDQGGLFYVKGGYQNILGLKPYDSDPKVRKNFRGDDDHPNYSDSQISEAMVAEAINRIAASRYWKQCAIIITWDDCEGDYDHVPPPLRDPGPDGLPLNDGPRVPLLLISPYARVHEVCHAVGNHASVVKFVDKLFNLIPLAKLPDELRARQIGQKKYGDADLGPADALTPGVTDLSGAFDPARLDGTAAPLPASYVMIPEKLIHTLPPVSGYGCQALGIVPVDKLLGIKNDVPADFNPRPKTDPTPQSEN
jgi:phospholipase C